MDDEQKAKQDFELRKIREKEAAQKRMLEERIALQAERDKAREEARKAEKLENAEQRKADAISIQKQKYQTALDLEQLKAQLQPEQIDVFFDDFVRRESILLQSEEHRLHLRALFEERIIDAERRRSESELMAHRETKLLEQITDLKKMKLASRLKKEEMVLANELEKDKISHKAAVEAVHSESSDEVSVDELSKMESFVKTVVFESG